MKHSILILFLSISLLDKAQNEDSKVYLFSYFKSNGQDGLHLAYSYDGLQYKTLKNDSSFVKPTAGKDKLMRDPCIIRGRDGKFHMVWTVSWNEKGIGYASSPDLVHWSQQQYIPVMEHEDSARNCWAPEIFYNAKEKNYIIFWATTITGRFPLIDTSAESKYNHRMYYVTTKDFKKYSKAKLLYEKGFNVIDATIVQDGKQYVMFLKDETRQPVQKNIRLATSKKAFKDYSGPSAPISGNYWAEGPTAVKIDGQWIVYFDKYRDRKYGAVMSYDLINWTDVSEKVSFPAGTRHGTVFTISHEEFRKWLGPFVR